MNDIRLNLGKICQIKMNKNNRPWVCTETVLVSLVMFAAIIASKVSEQKLVL